MIDIDRFYNTSSEISFDKEDLRQQFTMHGLRMLKNSANISHKTSFSIRSCRVSEAFLDECFGSLAGNKFIDTLAVTDIMPDSMVWTGPLCEFIKDNIRIKNLDIQGSTLAIKDFEMLSSAIVLNEKLQALNLSRIKIDIKSAPYVANIILCTNSIQSLIMRGNMMSSDGLVLLANALPLNKTLQTLNLSESNFTLPAAIALSASLHRPDSVLQLSFLELSCCNIDDEILNALLLGLGKKQRRSLTGFSLAGNLLTDACIPNIEDMDVNWPQLREILLTGNLLSEAAIGSLRIRLTKTVAHF